MRGLPLAAAGAAVIGLAACTNATTHSGAPTAHGSATPIAPVSCSVQYRSWANGEGKGLMGALEAITSAATDGNARLLKRALEHAGPTVARAAQHPIPACADPRGYWSVLLMHVNAATAGKGSPSSVRAAMRDVAKIHQQLVAEVTQIA